jgi:hypothetical protein
MFYHCSFSLECHLPRHVKEQRSVCTSGWKCRTDPKLLITLLLKFEWGLLLPPPNCNCYELGLQSGWLLARRTEFDSWHEHIFLRLDVSLCGEFFPPNYAWKLRNDAPLKPDCKASYAIRPRSWILLSLCCAGIAMVCWLSDRTSIPERIFFSIPQREDRLCSPPSLLLNGYLEFFPWGKAAGVWNWLLTSMYCRHQECLYARVLIQLSTRTTLPFVRYQFRTWPSERVKPVHWRHLVPRTGMGAALSPRPICFFRMVVIDTVRFVVAIHWIALGLHI